MNTKKYILRAQAKRWNSGVRGVRTYQEIVFEEKKRKSRLYNNRMYRRELRTVYLAKQRLRPVTFLAPWQQEFLKIQAPQIDFKKIQKLFAEMFVPKEIKQDGR